MEFPKRGCSLEGKVFFPASPLCFHPHLFLDKIADEAQAKEFLAEYNRTAEVVWNAYTEASWTYNTNITDHNKQIMV